MLNETRSLVRRPGMTLDIIRLTVTADFTVHIIIRLEFTMLSKPKRLHGLSYRLFARWPIISHLRVLHVQYVWRCGALDGTLFLLLGPSLALHVEKGCPDIILGGKLA